MSHKGQHNVGRRGFFRQALKEFVTPIIDPKDSPVEQTNLRLIRPPGALPENQFLNACSCSGRCIEICPANAIVQLKHDDPTLDGTPVINPVHSPCVVCDSLACTHVCPNGALLSLADPTQIRVGIAVVDDKTCVRTSNQSCNECVDKCPLGSSAIVFDHEGAPTILEGCVGCGVCEYYCPTSPKSIVIELHT